MARHQFLTSEKYAGVDVTYDKRDQTVTLSGWYDTHVGIAPETVTLARFLRALGVTVEDCRKALDGENHA